MTPPPPPAPPSASPGSAAGAPIGVPSSAGAVRFLLNGRPIALTGRDALRPLTELLRERLGLTGTKVVCAEGDCGACTVLLGRPASVPTLGSDAGRSNGKRNGQAGTRLDYRPVDACILFAFQCHGTHVVTVEGLHGRQDNARTTPALNPKPNAEAQRDEASGPTPLTVLQRALVDGHGSQCGFCTPGIVMALHGLHELHAGVNCENHLRHALSGNLCRCTGYQQILDACAALDPQAIPQLADVYDEPALRRALDGFPSGTVTLDVDLPDTRPSPKPVVNVPAPTTNGQPSQFPKPDAKEPRDEASADDHSPPWLHRAALPMRRITLHLPATLEDALKLKADHPGALLVAGATDIGVWHNHGTPWPDHVVALTNLPELCVCTNTGDTLRLGGGASWDDASTSVAPNFPGFVDILDRFGSPQIRQLGTIAGNVANGSPIADSLPLLFAMDAEVEAASHARGTRTIPITGFYTGYKQHVLQSDELITAVRLPKPGPTDRLHLEKVSKRRDMDISTFTAAIRLTLDPSEGTIKRAAVALGGVAATVVRLPNTEQQLAGQPFTEATLRAAGGAARGEITPISDVRGGAGYRHQLAENVFAKAWHAWQQERKH